MSVQDAQAPTRSTRLRTVFGIGAGNALEWFDWNIYATFTVFFASQFFHTASPVSAVLKTLAVFAVGFIARPVGGFVFGWLADRRGRQLSMTLAVALAAFGSLVIGLSPTHESIGSWAGVILLTCRLAQGLAQGGEIPAAQTYIAEVAPRQRRGLWTSLLYVSGTLGVLTSTLLAAVLSTLLTQTQMSDFGWRIPFILGGAFGVFAFYMRTSMSETSTFTAEASKEHRVSVWKNLRENPGLLLRVIGLTAGGTVVYYVWTVSAPANAIAVHGTPTAGAMWAGFLAHLVFLGLLPVWGHLSDKIGRKPPVIVAFGVLIVAQIPLSSIVQGRPWQLFAAMALAMTVIASLTSIRPAMFAEMFPTGIRTVGFGIPYSVAVALFGGTAPYLQTYLADHGETHLFNWYVMGLLMLSLITVVFMPETKGRDLTEVRLLQSRPDGSA